MVDHEAICDCPFMDHCQTYTDPLIGKGRKGPEGMGCHVQNDVYRGKHCRKFALTYLTMVLEDAAKHLPSHANQPTG